MVNKTTWVACVQTFPASSKTGCLLVVLRIYCWFAFAFWNGYCSGSFQSFVLIMSFGDHTRLQHQKNRIGRNRGVWWCRWLRACLHEGGEPRVGEVTCGALPHLTCKRDHTKMRDYMDRRVTPPTRVISPTWGPPPPCKQALSPKQERLGPG